MRIIFVNRYFHPDESATAQLLTDLAVGLADRDYQVHVLCSRQLYGDPGARLASRGTFRGVIVHRLWTTRFGRGGLSGRAADYASFYAACAMALTRLARWAVPGMVQRQRGWICHVGSSAGILPLPTFAVYAATKAYVNSFSEALRVEVRAAGVKVLALCPGPIETEFGQVASRPDGKRKFSAPAGLAVAKEEVVAQTLDALASGRGRLIPGLAVRLPMLLAESTPRFLMRAFFTALSGRFRPEGK